jgi:hypothetical protein
VDEPNDFSSGLPDAQTPAGGVLSGTGQAASPEDEAMAEKARKNSNGVEHHADSERVKGTSRKGRPPSVVQSAKLLRAKLLPQPRALSAEEEEGIRAEGLFELPPRPNDRLHK